MVIPYYHMTTPQKEFLISLVDQTSKWVVHDYVMTWKRSGDPQTIPVLSVLLGLCEAMLSCKVYF